MKYKQLERFASELQVEADRMAYKIVKTEKIVGGLSVIQSMCNFNIFWLYQVSPLIITEKTIDFMSNYRDKFKRELSVKEVMHIDWLVSHGNFHNFSEFSEAYKQTKEAVV